MSSLPFRLVQRIGDWYTPNRLFEFFHFQHGPYDIDVAAHATNSLCPIYYTPEQDGLKQPWAPKKCWCNPPYGKVLTKWVAKAFMEAQAGAIVTLLLPGQTDADWFHDYILNKAQIIYFIQGRVKFGDAEHPATFPSIAVHFDFSIRKRGKLPMTQYVTLDYRKRGAR